MGGRDAAIAAPGCRDSRTPGQAAQLGIILASQAAPRRVQRWFIAPAATGRNQYSHGGQPYRDAPLTNRSACLSSRLGVVWPEVSPVQGTLAPSHQPTDSWSVGPPQCMVSPWDATARALVIDLPDRVPMSPRRSGHTFWSGRAIQAMQGRLPGPGSEAQGRTPGRGGRGDEGASAAHSKSEQALGRGLHVAEPRRPATPRHRACGWSEPPGTASDGRRGAQGSSAWASGEVGRHPQPAGCVGRW